jgi:hypothetical protein
MIVTTTLQSQARSINPAGDNDYIRFQASAGTYTFYTSGSIDTYGYLYSSSQTQLASDDDSGGSYQFRIAYTITASGYYFLRVRGYSSSTTGAYTLYFSYQPSTPPPSGDFYEPDNSFSQYSTMTVTTSLQYQTRTIEPTNDNDYIRFYVSSSNYGVYTFYTQSFIDTYGYLYNSAQSQLASNDDGGGTYQFRIVYTIGASGYYFLRVRGYSSSTHGIYTLYYGFVPQNIATPLPLRNYVLGTLTGTGDVDYYQVQVDSGRRLRINLDGQNDQNFDLYVRYSFLPSTSGYDASSVTASANEFIEISNTQSGTYYIMVRSSGGSGRYIIEPYYPLTDVYLEVDYMSGCAPRTELLTYLTNYYRNSFNIQVHITTPTEVTRSQLEAIGVSPDSLTENERVLIEQHFHDNPTYVYVFYASSFAVEGTITSDTLGLSNVPYGAFLPMDRINSILNYLELIQPANLERVVLLHEVGHCLGIVEYDLSEGHTYEEVYCSNRNCVMSMVESISALGHLQWPAAWDSTPEYCTWHASMIGRWFWSTNS